MLNFFERERYVVNYLLRLFSFKTKLNKKCEATRSRTWDLEYQPLSP